MSHEEDHPVDFPRQPAAGPSDMMMMMTMTMMMMMTMMMIMMMTMT